MAIPARGPRYSIQSTASLRLASRILIDYQQSCREDGPDVVELARWLAEMGKGQGHRSLTSE